MTRSKTACLALAVSLFAATRAFADYESRPDLLPQTRCAGVSSLDCQPLYWDIPATQLGQVRSIARLAGRLGLYPNGITDRPPPLYTDETNGYEQPGGGRTPLCTNANEVPYWKPRPDLGVVGGKVQNYEVACHRGTRIHYGPWQVGNNFERTWDAVVRVENSLRLDQDQQNGDIPSDGSGRREWFTAIEIYNHIGSHHANMWDPVNACNDPDRPDYASSQECQDNYQQPDYDQSGCRSDVEGPQPSCAAYGALSNPSQWRAATQFPGRFEVTFPPGKALPLLEDQLWPMEHHVVSNYAGGDFRNQVGGTVGEIILQVLTEPFSDPNLERISVLFETAMEAASLFVPPFTIAPNQGVWYAPYDLELALLTTHSHKRTVRSWIDVLPANPYRPSDVDFPICGGAATNGAPATHVFENYHWDDANTCKYYEQPDGNIILHKGEGLAFGCLFNNGVIQTNRISDPNLRAAVEEGVIGKQLLYGEQDPSIYRVHYGCEERPDWQSVQPEDTTTPGVAPGLPPLMPARRCDPNPGVDAAGNPIDGPYPPGPSQTQCPRGEEGPSTGQPMSGRCVPANIVFANADDEMCIMVGMYWPLPRPLDVNADVDGGKLRQGLENQDSQSLQESVIVDEAAPISTDPSATDDPTHMGMPGVLPKSPSDLGKCQDCSKLFPPLI
jgi:hypothetical protein